MIPRIFPVGPEGWTTFWTWAVIVRLLSLRIVTVMCRRPGAAIAVTMRTTDRIGRGAGRLFRPQGARRIGVATVVRMEAIPSGARGAGVPSAHRVALDPSPDLAHITVPAKGGATCRSSHGCKWPPRGGSRRPGVVRSGSRAGNGERRKATNDPYCDRTQREIARARRSNNEDRDVRVQLQSENPPTVPEERDLARTFHAKRRAHHLDRPDQRGGHHGQDLERDVVPSPSGEQPPGPGKQDDGLERVVRLDQRCQVNRSRCRGGHLRIPRLVSAQEAKRSKDRLSVVQVMAPLRPVKDRDETTSGTPKEFNAAPRRCLSPWSLRAKVPPVAVLAKPTVRDSRIKNRRGREGSCPMPPLEPGPKSRLLWTCSWRKGGGDEG